MRKPKAIGLGAKLLDDESRGIIYDGCSISQLSSIFEVDNRDVSRRIRDIAPSGERMGYPIYRIRDVAGCLVAPSPEEVREAITRMQPRDLPPALTKEYWAGQHARLKFEEDNGDLWRTGDVIETFSEVFKTARMSILLMRDQVERQSDLTHRQRDIIQSLIDGVLNELADTLTKRFQDENPRRNNEDGEWADPQESEDEEPL